MTREILIAVNIAAQRIYRTSWKVVLSYDTKATRTRTAIGNGHQHCDAVRMRRQIMESGSARGRRMKRAQIGFASHFATSITPNAPRDSSVALLCILGRAARWRGYNAVPCYCKMMMPEPAALAAQSGIGV